MSDQQKLEALERLTAAVSELKAMFEYDTAIQAADLSTERNTYMLSPNQGQTFVGASQVFTISDIGGEQWRIRASVGTQSSFEDGEFFESGAFVDESNTINVTSIPVTGQLITIEISVGSESEHSVSYRSYVAHEQIINVGVGILDESLVNARLYERNSDGSDGPRVFTAKSGSQYNFYYDKVDGSGAYMGDVNGATRIQEGSISFQSNTGNTDFFTYTAPSFSGDPRTERFSFEYDGPSDGRLTAEVLSFSVSGLVVDSETGYSLPTAGMSAVIIPTTDYGFDKSMSDSVVAGIWDSAGLTRQYGHAQSVGTQDFAGRRALMVRQKPFPNYQVNDRPTWAARFDNYTTTYRCIYRFYLEDGHDFGPQAATPSNQRNGQTAKLGFGFASEQESSGGVTGPDACSARIEWRRYESNATQRLSVYLYHSNQIASTGDNLDTGIDMDTLTGRWVEVAMDAQANSSYSASDGRLRCWVDGELMIERDDIQYMSVRASGDPATPHFRRAFFSNFYGGSTGPEWTPETEQIMRFADPYVGTGLFTELEIEEDYLSFDHSTSQANFKIYRLDGSLHSGDLIYGEQYNIQALWVDSNGDYAGSNPVIPMDVSQGSESFVERVPGTNFNQYLYTPPASGTGPLEATFTWGKYDAEGEPILALATANLNINSSSVSDSTVETTRTSSSDFTSRLILNSPQPAKLWYRIQGESSYAERVPYETSSNFSVHNQAVPGTEGKVLSAGDVVECYWQHGENLQFQSPVETITLRQSSSGSGQFRNVIDLNSIGTVSQGSWTREKWEEVFGSRAAYTPTNMSHLSIINDNGKHKIRQRHQASSQGTARIIAPFNIPESNEVRIIQTIEVDPSFTWGTTGFSGKLGWGFGGGQNTSGGLSDPKGFTGRISWDDDGELAFYSYAANRQNGGNSSFGEEIGTGFHITPGVPFTVEMHATMNSSFGASDGTFKMWVNGNLELDLVGIGWQTQAFGNETAPHIDRIAYSQFHGGADGRWSPTTSPTYANNYDMSWE